MIFDEINGYDDIHRLLEKIEDVRYAVKESSDIPEGETRNELVKWLRALEDRLYWLWMVDMSKAKFKGCLELFGKAIDEEYEGLRHCKMLWYEKARSST